MSKTKILEYLLASSAETIRHSLQKAHLFVPFQLVHGGNDVSHLLQVDATAVVHVIHPENYYFVRKAYPNQNP